MVCERSVGTVAVTVFRFEGRRSCCAHSVAKRASHIAHSSWISCSTCALARFRPTLPLHPLHVYISSSSNGGGNNSTVFASVSHPKYTVIRHVRRCTWTVTPRISTGSMACRTRHHAPKSLNGLRDTRRSLRALFHRFPVPPRCQAG